MIKTKRDLVEERLLDRFKEIKPFVPGENKVIERYKDESFGVSNIAFALYSNGHNLRGKSSNLL